MKKHAVEKKLTLENKDLKSECKTYKQRAEAVAFPEAVTYDGCKDYSMIPQPQNLAPFVTTMSTSTESVFTNHKMLKELHPEPPPVKVTGKRYKRRK